MLWDWDEHTYTDECSRQRACLDLYVIDGVADGAVGVGNGGTQTTLVEPLSVLSIITITQALIHNSWPVMSSSLQCILPGK